MLERREFLIKEVKLLTSISSVLDSYSETIIFFRSLHRVKEMNRRPVAILKALAGSTWNIFLRRPLISLNRGCSGPKMGCDSA